MTPKNTICLWFDKDALEAARFYAATFPDSKVTAVHKAPSDYPGGKKGEVLTVDFTVLGIPCLGLNGGPTFKHSEAFSFQVATDNQEETDRYWNAIVGNGGQESQCGWCKDRWGLSWQITPRVLTDAHGGWRRRGEARVRGDDADEEDRHRHDRGCAAGLTWSAERKGSGMARLVFGMNQSLDGYVDHMAFAPSPTLFRHFIEEAQGQAGSVYGRQMYEVMRYWDDDHPEWDAEEHAFAAAWRNQPKWVVSRSLKSVGPNARLVEDDLEGAIRELKAERDGEIEVAGPDLAQSLTELGLIDEYRIYLHPVVLGHGKPYFAGPRPPLRLMANDRIGEDVIRLAYVPA